MIIIHEGTPGSGKSYDAIRKVIDALKTGRTVYARIDGVDIEECREALAAMTGLTRDALKEKYVHLKHDEIPRFWEICPPGAFVVIDEAQLYFNSRDWSKDENRKFSDWASTHRHHGYDLLLITQRAERIDSAVRSLAEFRYRYRKLNVFGSLVQKGYLMYSYCGDDNKPLTTKKMTYEVPVFACYKSYVGDATEKQVVKPPNILRHPVVYAMVACLGLFAYFFSQSSFASGDPLGYDSMSKKYKEARVVGDGEPVTPPATAGGSPAAVPSPVAPSYVPPSMDGLELVTLPFQAYVGRKGGKELILVQGQTLSRSQWVKYDLVAQTVTCYLASLPASIQVR